MNNTQAKSGSMYDYLEQLVVAGPEGIRAGTVRHDSTHVFRLRKTGWKIATVRFKQGTRYVIDYQAKTIREVKIRRNWLATVFIWGAAVLFTVILASFLMQFVK